jgi:hypothetical protein
MDHGKDWDSDECEVVTRLRTFESTWEGTRKLTVIGGGGG